MKRGGQVIYAGSLGRHSEKLIEYFEVSVSRCYYYFIIYYYCNTLRECL